MAPRAALISLGLLTAGACSSPPATGPVATASAPVEASRTATSCYAPLPGHPTPAEQQAFVADIGPLASRAEERYGVPAAAITAMAIQESGYGWTELAQETNNVLAWKYVSASAAGGRDAWTLDCGTVSDRFVVFKDRADAIDYVAQQLASSDNYAADTARYRQDRAEGMDPTAAVDRWVDGIADPYSSNPDAYRSALRDVLNGSNPPSGSGDADAGLYALSAAVTPGEPS
ncbi:MAG: glucosaminidase domain-containing protein [Geminicoccaceae bacterium]